MRKKRTNKINRKHKDRLFLMVFREGGALLELYNALNGTTYTNVGDLEITTLEDAVYMRMKNDVSFIFNHELHLYEHQSTSSGNMSLRGLFYIVDVLRGYIEKQGLNVFSSKQISLPLPRYIVFYNGERHEPDQRELRLSKAYEVFEEELCLEFRATLLNVNFGHNQALMERSRSLYEYAKFIHYIRTNQKQGQSLSDAVNKAVDTCIEEGILGEFLRKHRGEVYRLLLTEYNEQKFLEQEREVWKEDGRSEGFSEGLAQGEERIGRLIQHLIRENRNGEIERAVTDPEYQKQLLDALGL